MHSWGFFDATNPGGFHGYSDILHRTHNKSIIPNVESASQKNKKNSIKIPKHPDST